MSALLNALSLSSGGLAVHWLHERSKRPRGNNWSERPVATPEKLERTYRDGFNVGIRLGEPSCVDGRYYLHVIDVDIRDPDYEEEALAALDERLPGWEDFPRVKSGSGGPSFHVYFFTTEPFDSKKLAHSSERIEWTDHAGKTHHSWAWELERFGSGKQVACPPSIHPETGDPYKWLKEIDFRKLKFGLGPIVEPDQVANWSRPRDDSEEWSSTHSEDESAAGSPSSTRPLDLSTKEIKEILYDLDFDEWCRDYEGWLRAGMALHHQFEGGSEGLDLWHEFSSRADNYEAEALDDKWRSFGKDKSRRNVTFATLKGAARVNHTLRQLAGAEVEDADAEDVDDHNSTDWHSTLDITANGTVKKSMSNLHRILNNDARMHDIFGFNLFTDKPVLTRKPHKKKAKTERRQKHIQQLHGERWRLLDPKERLNGKPLDEQHFEDVRRLVDDGFKKGGYGVTFPSGDVTRGIQSIAIENAFHPVQQWLEAQTWDGVPRAETMFIDWLGASDDEYHRQTARIWLIAAIARVYTPGHKFDCAPILEGKQGIGKSSFIRALAVQWFTELNCDLSDPKAVVEVLSGHWIAELPEIAQFRKGEIEGIKAFFSAGADTVRLAYRRDGREHKRQSVYMGSTNNREYLRDPTGNRRFWPIECHVDRVDFDGLAAAVPQIWAEAFVMYREMCEHHNPAALPLYLKGRAAAHEALELQESRRVETEADAWGGLIAAWADDKVPLSTITGGKPGFSDSNNDDPLVQREIICALQVWVEVLGGAKERYNSGTAARINEALRGLEGWDQATILTVPGYGRQRAFRRVG